MNNESKKEQTYNNFIKRAKEIYGDKYDYSLVEYVNYRSPIKIICPEHGVFIKTPLVFLSAKQGCRLCGIKKRIQNSRNTLTEFIEKAEKIHGDKYDYSQVKYVNSHTYIKIICPEHGAFEQLPYVHLQGHNCPKCGNVKKSINKLKKTDCFIEEANKIHYFKYDYSRVKYKGNNKKVEIICPEHGSFYQKPNNHLNGEGCPFCKGSYGEQLIFYLLKKIIKDKVVFQKTFNCCKFEKVLPFDFYIPNRNIIIEYMGEQHYKWIKYFHKTYKDFLIQKHRDWLKRKFCYENDIIYFKIDYNDNILEKIKEFFYE